MSFRAAVLFSVLSAFLVLLGTSMLGCPQPPQTPGGFIEAGAPVVTGACKLIEGVTQNQTAISACATAEEIALIATTIGQFLRPMPGGDAGPCTFLPDTAVCATPKEMGRGIQLVLEHRRRRLVFEAGAP